MEKLTCLTCYWDRHDGSWHGVYADYKKDEHCSLCTAMASGWEPRHSALKKAIEKIRRENHE